VPIIDCHGRIFPREGQRVSFARVFIGFLVSGEEPRDHEILHHVVVLEVVLDGVRMVRAGLLKESLKVVCQWLRLMLDTTTGGRNALHAGVVHLIVVVVVVVNCVCDPLRAPILPLLATLGVLLGALNGDVGWRCIAAAKDHCPPPRDKERFGYLLASGVLGGDTEQLLDGVPKNVVKCLKRRRLLRVAHVALRCLWSLSLRTTTVLHPVAVSALAWVPHVAFGLHAHVPLISLATCKGFGTLALLPWRALG
jgi:hypothetical protein